jgi:DNA-binding CsgD family transcriptional regulator
MDVAIMTNFETRPPGEHPGQSKMISRIVEDLIDRMTRDSHTWYHWKGYSPDMKSVECRGFTELVASGGRDPALAQRPAASPYLNSLRTGRVDWSNFIRLAGETLDQSGLSAAEQEQLFSLLTRSKVAIAGKTPAQSPVGVFAAFPHELTDREMDVLRLLAIGKTNSEIADELFISINTVTRHITNIFTKTSTRNRVEAAVYAAKRQLV